MFFTYLRRELRRRRKAALVVASGLALGIALVIIVSSVSSGMSKAQDKVLESLYGLGTDMTVIAVGLTGAYIVTAISPTLTAQLGGSGGGGGMVGGPGGPVRQTAAKSLDIALTAPVSLSTILIAVVLAVAGGLIAGAFGGWRASRLRPADALRRVE
ncbi:hypothetical protein [Streptomyces sp. NPDC048496]|uniref:hypothetical protein n=1 Tax=Streptomyces sp. NPDC048496 TaxID=3365558 RepID=UPI0037230E27